MNEVNDSHDWVERAEEDFVMARSALRRKTPLIYPACFHAQQCAEKYLKAILVSHSVVFPRTHDLLMIFTLCTEAGIIIPIDMKALNALNDYSVKIRYPGENPSLEDAQDAFKITKCVRHLARKFLGIS